VNYRRGRRWPETLSRSCLTAQLSWRQLPNSQTFLTRDVSGILSHTQFPQEYGSAETSGLGLTVNRRSQSYNITLED
jgi:hypothetical protein